MSEPNTFQSGIPAPIGLPVGFAEGGTVGADVMTAFPLKHTVGCPSFSAGFPSSFEVPSANGGNAIERKHINGLGYLSTANESQRQRGSIVTYDEDLVEQTGGYAKGAVLDWWDGANENLMKVVSLVDGNDYDFRIVGPDGVHWQQCSSNQGWLPDYAKDGRTIIASFDSLQLSKDFAFVSQEVEMPFDGYLNCFCNLKAEPPVADVPYWTYADKYCGVKTGDNSASSSAYKWSATEGEGVPLSENIRMSAFSAFSECYHKLYVCVGSSLSGVSTANPLTSTGCGIFMISSSGLEGSAAQMMIPVRRGNKIRLLGMQNYTEEHKITYARFDYTGYTTYGGIFGKGGTSPKLLDNTIKRKGSFSISCVIEAYPTKESGQ